MTGREFEKLVEEGLSAIPEKFVRLLKNVAIVIAEEPTPKQRKTAGLRADETLLGLYEGIPQTRRNGGYAGVLPDKITIFRKPILEAALRQAQGKLQREDVVREIVRDTVWHEIAHHFGMEEDEVSRAEERRLPRSMLH